MISANVIYLTTCNKYRYSKIYELIIINTLILLAFIIKCLFGNFAFIVEFVFLIIIPIIYLTKNYPGTRKIKLILFPIIIQLLVMIWQLNILFIRNVDMNKINDEYFLLGFALQLDYYIFIIISWIGVTKMGLWSVWFFSKDITVLKSYKEKELAKDKPDMDLVKKIDSRIEKLEKEGK